AERVLLAFGELRQTNIDLGLAGNARIVANAADPFDTPELIVIRERINCVNSLAHWQIITESESIKEPRGRSRSQSYSQIALLHSHLFLHDQLTFADISGTDSFSAADAEARILGQPVYIGKLQRGSRILIVDDVITFGSTLANLRGWIEKQGAKVVGATTLAAGFGATKLALPESVHERLLEKFPVQAEALANEFGFTAACFTNREARFLCGLKNERDIERLVATAHE